MEAAASTVVDFFYDRLVGTGGLPACVLARCFQTHRFADLPATLRRLAVTQAEEPLLPETQCLTLLATRGTQPEWNSRHGSAKHRVIPLATVATVAQAPMIHQLVLQLGLSPEQVVRPQANFHDDKQETFGVFYVRQARGSVMVPAQEEFVEPHQVASVLGFGGLLPAGELFAVILFTVVDIAPETAALFRTLALSVKLHLLPFSGKPVFIETNIASGATSNEHSRAAGKVVLQ